MQLTMKEIEAARTTVSVKYASRLADIEEKIVNPANEEAKRLRKAARADANARMKELDIAATHIKAHGPIELEESDEQ